MSKTLITKFTDESNQSINIFQLIMAVKFSLMNLLTVTKDNPLVAGDIYAQLSLLSRVANIFNWDLDEINDPKKRLEVSLESMQKVLNENVVIVGERYRGQNKISVQKASQVSMDTPLHDEHCNHLKIDGSIQTVRELAQHLVVILNKLEAKQPGSDHQNSGEAGDPTGGKSPAKERSPKRSREDFTPAECLIDLEKSWGNLTVLLKRYGTSLTYQCDVGELFQTLTEMSDWLKSNCDAGRPEIAQLDAFLKEYREAQKMEDDSYESPVDLKAWEDINQIAKRFVNRRSFDNTTKASTKASTPKAGKKARQASDDGQASPVILLAAANDSFDGREMVSPLSLSALSSHSSSPPVQDERLSKKNELIERLRKDDFQLLEHLNSYMHFRLDKAIKAFRKKDGPLRTTEENIDVDKIYRNNKFTNTSFSLLLSVVDVAYEEESKDSALSRRRWAVWVELDRVLCDRMVDFIKHDNMLSSYRGKKYDPDSEARDVFSSDDYDAVSKFLDHVEKQCPASASFPHALPGGSSTKLCSSSSSNSFFRPSDAPKFARCMDEDPSHAQIC